MPVTDSNRMDFLKYFEEVGISLFEIKPKSIKCDPMIP